MIDIKILVRSIVYKLLGLSHVLVYPSHKVNYHIPINSTSSPPAQPVRADAAAFLGMFVLIL